MNFDDLAVRLPSYAKDLEINLARLSADDTLTEQQKWGCFVACAFALGQGEVLEAVSSEARTRLSDEAIVAAKTAATIMAMNTVYYGAVNFFQNRDYRSEPPKLSMLAMANPGVAKIDFELWALAVSALSNCQTCLNVHEAELHKRGTPLEVVQTALRIASVINAIAVVLRAEPSQAA
jgi:alkyl hydroperoxide reductase subunit D